MDITSITFDKASILLEPINTIEKQTFFYYLIKINEKTNYSEDEVKSLVEQVTNKKSLSKFIDSPLFEESRNELDNLYHHFVNLIKDSILK